MKYYLLQGVFFMILVALALLNVWQYEAHHHLSSLLVAVWCGALALIPLGFLFRDV